MKHTLFLLLMLCCLFCSGQVTIDLDKIDSFQTEIHRNFKEFGYNDSLGIKCRSEGNILKAVEYLLVMDSISNVVKELRVDYNDYITSILKEILKSNMDFDIKRELTDKIRKLYL